MEDLKIDCLVSIFQRLNIDDLIITIPLVCKTWYKASKHPLCYQLLHFHTLDFHPNSKFAKRYEAQHASPFVPSFSGFMKLVVLRSCELATELTFPLHGVSIHDLYFASTWCPRLKRIALLEDEMEFIGLIGKWKYLEGLEMELKPSNFRAMLEEIRNNCKSFTELRIPGSFEMEDALGIVETLPNIKYLDLNRSYLPKEALVIIMKGCKQLEWLRANRCIGFEVDEDLMEFASNIRIFEHEGSQMHDTYVCSYVNGYCWERWMFQKF